MLEMKKRYIDLEVGHELESHAETVYEFQHKHAANLVEFHIENLIATFGVEVVKSQIKAQLKLTTTRRKSTKKAA